MEDLNKQIKKGISQSRSQSGFGVSLVPNHTHNGVDSPVLYSPTTTYIGFVPSDGDIGGTLEVILPVGWSIEYSGTGEYIVHHNLGSGLYSCVATATQSTDVVVECVISPFANEVDFFWFNGGAATPQDTSFSFILVQINNKRQAFPKYLTRNIPNF